jgi:hypothetical protein
MKHATLTIALVLASTSTFAATWGEGNNDTLGYVLDDPTHAYIGTGLADAAPAVNIYGAFASDEARDGFRVGAITPRASGNPDEAGSILVDLGVRP